MECLRIMGRHPFPVKNFSKNYAKNLTYSEHKSFILACYAQHQTYFSQNRIYYCIATIINTFMCITIIKVGHYLLSGASILTMQGVF